jgi:hypothetical protein
MRVDLRSANFVTTSSDLFAHVEAYQYGFCRECFNNFGITRTTIHKLSSWGLAMFLKKHLFPILVIVFALVAALATYFAHSYRLTNPPQANFFDSIDYIAMGGLFLVIAKINLARNPQHQNLAIVTAVFAGIVFSNAAEKIISLVWK